MKAKQRMQKSHLMRTIEVVALILALLIVETVIGIAIHRRTSEIAYNGLMDNYAQSISRFAQELDVAILQGEARRPADFSATVTGKTMVLNDTGRSYGANATQVENFRVRGINLYRLEEICDNLTADNRIKSDEAVYVIYSQVLENGTIQLSFHKLATILAGISPAGFDGIAVFSDSNRTEFLGSVDQDGNWIGSVRNSDQSVVDQLKDFRRNSQTVGAETVKVQNKVYALTVTQLQSAERYSVGGYADFVQGQKALLELTAQIVLSAVGIGILTAFVISLCAFLFGKRNEKKIYHFSVDPEGLIIQRNKQFEKDFPNVRQISERLNRFDEDQVYTLRVDQGGENKLLSCVVKKQFDGTVDVTARELLVPAGDEIDMERKDNLAAAYQAFSKEHTKVLLGEIYFNNLLEIKDVFGREFAETVRNLLLDRARKQFESVFIFDYYTLGVLQPDGTRLDIMLRDMDRVVADLNRVAKAGDNNVLVSVKCGFALSDSSVKPLSYGEIMEASDAALKRACEPQPDILNRVDYYVFQESQRKLYSKFLFKIDIPQMLQNGDFYLEYQPQYGLEQDRIVGFEALFRVQRRVQINVSVMDIINYAERSGNMVLLGNYILNEGMKFAKSIEGKGVTVSLNVSPVQMMQTGFVDNFLKIYHSYDLQPGSISVEITESYLVSDIGATLKKLEVLRANGIDIHLDDFGTGYSSFGYLSQLPISTIKVDQSFVRDITENRVSCLITKTIVDICKSLNLKSICEGVENHAQLELVRSLGCDIIQGYVISRSVKDEVARDMIENYHYQAPVVENTAETPKKGK